MTYESIAIFKEWTVIYFVIPTMATTLTFLNASLKPRNGLAWLMCRESLKRRLGISIRDQPFDLGTKRDFILLSFWLPSQQQFETGEEQFLPAVTLIMSQAANQLAFKSVIGR